MHDHGALLAPILRLATPRRDRAGGREAVRGYTFGPFELDVACFRLRRDGVALAIQPRVFDVLRYLIERRDRLVGADELRGALWSEVTVGPGAVAWTVCRARRALGQAHGSEAPIRSVRSRGYQFIGDVRAEPWT